MTRKKAIEILKLLKQLYPDAKCSLDFSNSFELLIAVILSAQCTDERVNKTTPMLFENYNTPKAIANMELSTLENIIHPCGFYKNKAKNIKATAQKILDDYNGEVPKTIEELMNLPGVGRKTANVVMLEAFNLPKGIAVDTHAKRLSNRLGLSQNSDPLKIEQDLLKLFPKEYYKDINHIFIYHGRNICKSQNPKCKECAIYRLCENHIKAEFK